MSSDIKLFQNASGVWSCDFTNGDFELTQGLDTAIYMSITSYARALPSQVSEPLSRRGHFINEFSDVNNYEIGSTSWRFVERQKNTLPNTVNLQKEIKKSLQWVISDGFALSLNINTTIINSESIKVDITLDANKSNERQYTMFINTFSNGN